jgi:hypothetical protein
MNFNILAERFYCTECKSTLEFLQHPYSSINFILKEHDGYDVTGIALQWKKGVNYV